MPYFVIWNYLYFITIIISKEIYFLENSRKNIYFMEHNSECIEA